MGWERQRLSLIDRVFEVVDFLVSRPRLPARPRRRDRRPVAPTDSSPRIEPRRFFAEPDPDFPDLRPHLRPEAWVLDLGCGQGRNLHALGTQGFRAVGMDRFDEKRASPPRGRPLVRADLFALPWRDGVFDAVVAWQVLCQFSPDQARLAVAEVARVLQPGGLFVLSGCYGTRAWDARGGLALFEPFVTLDTHTLEPVHGWPRLRWVVLARKGVTLPPSN